MSKEFIAKLEKWVKDNKEEAETPTINITVGKEFTIKGILDKIKQEIAEDVAVLDEKENDIRRDLEEWMEEINGG